MDSTGGALHFDADIDNRKYLQKIIAMENRIDQFALNVIKSNQTVERSYARMANTIGNGKLGQSLAGLETNVKSFQTTADRATTAAANSFNQLGDQISRGRLASALTSTETRLGSLGRVAANGTNSAGRSIQGLAQTTEQSTDAMSASISKVTGYLAGFLSIQAATNFVSKVIDIRSEFEKLDVSFSTILKSKVKADALMADVVKFAATTPFKLTEVATTTKQLLAYGVAAGDIKDELTTLGNVAAGVSQPIGEIAYLYGTLKTQGRAYAMDIRQFTGRGIPIVAELAKQFGVASSEVMKLVEQGKVGFPEVQKAFQAMTGSGGAFFDLMAKQSLTTGGRISNLKDQIDVLFNEIGKGNSGLINAGISGAQTLVANYGNIVDSLELMITAYGAYRAAMILTAAVNEINLKAAAARIAAINGETAAEQASIASKKALVIQMGLSRGAALTEAEAKAVSAEASVILAAQEQASIARKAALAASSAFYTAKQELETAVKAGAAAATIAELQAEVSLLAVRKAEATQLATGAAAELANIEAKTLNAAATAELTAAEVIRTIRLGLVAKAQAFYNTVLAAAPLVAGAAAFTILAAAIYSVTQANNTLNEAQKGVNSILADAEGKRTREVARIKDYVKIATDAASTDEQRAKAIKKLNDLSPQFLSGLNLANVATAEGSRLINVYLQDLDRKALGELAYAQKQANISKIIDLQTKGTEAISNGERFGTGLKNFFEGNLKFGIGDQAAKAGEKLLVDQKIKIYEDANKEIDKKYGKQIRDYQLLDVTGADTEIKPDTTRNEKFVKAEIERLEALRSAVGLTTKAYQDYTSKIKALQKELADAQGKVSSDDKKALNERLSALKAIEVAEQKANQRTLSDTAEKLQKAKDDAANLRKQAKAAGLGAGSLTRIDNIEKTTTGAISYEADTNLLLKEIERQKGIYAKYEQYKVDVSETAANERYGNEKADFKTFGDYLQSEIGPLYDKVYGGETLTGKEQDRLNKLLEIQKGYGIERAEFENKQYADALNAAASLGEKITNIQAKYANMAIALGRNATNQRKTSLLKERDIAIDAARDEAYQKTEIYRQLAEETLVYTLQEAKNREKALTNILKTDNLTPDVRAKLTQSLNELKFNLKLGIDQANLRSLKDEYNKLVFALDGSDKPDTFISEAEKKRIIKRLQEIQDKINGIDANNDGKTTFADKLAANFEYLKGSTSDIAEGVAKDLGRVSGSFSELSTALGGTDTQAGYLVDTFAKMAEIGANAAGAFASFSSGDIIGGVTKTISAVAGVFSLGKKVKEMNAAARAEAQKYYNDVAAGEMAYQAMLRDRERQILKINAISLRGISDESAALKKQKSQIDADYADTLAQLQAQSQGQVTGSTYKHGTLFRKAKTTYQYAGLAGLDYTQLEELYSTNKLTEGAKALFEELKKLKEEGADVDAALKDAAQAANELATGTTVQTLSSNIISNLREGKTKLKDVMDDYTQIIQDALLSTFQSDVVDVEMKKFYERLSLLAQSDGKLTPEEIERAKTDYIDTRKKIQDQFDALSKITGVDLKDPKTTEESGITASVKSLTQDTGVAIEGLMRGIYDIIKKNADLNTQNSVTLAKQLELMGYSISIQTETRDHAKTIAINSQSQIERMDSMIGNLINIVTNTKPTYSRDKGLDI